MAFAVATLAGCGDKDERPADWAFIAPMILAPNCATASCHSPGAAAAGLDLSDAKSAYRSLLGQQAQYFLPQPPLQDTATCKGQRTGTVCLTPRPMVQPCRPDESRIVNMMRGRGAQLMPPDRPLPVADIELIERWILAGAKERATDPLPTCALVPAAVVDAAAGGLDSAPVVNMPDANMTGVDAGASDAAAPQVDAARDAATGSLDGGVG